LGIDDTFKIVPKMVSTICHAFAAALIPAIRRYFLNTRVQSCYFHFCQEERMADDRLPL
ncbi:hypothetical protein T4B_12513, partial [Trichinella pseudospiralis]